MINAYAQNQRGSAHMVVAIAIFLIITGGIGYLFLQNIVNKPVATDGYKSDSAVTSNGWKQYVSNKYGLSIYVKNDWNVDVTDTSNIGNTSVSFQLLTPNMQDKAYMQYISIETDTLKDLKGRSENLMPPPNKSKAYFAAQKWYGYDALVYTDPENDGVKMGDHYTSNISKKLYVQVGNKVYTLPYVVKTSDMTSDIDDYNRFVELIRITKK